MAEPASILTIPGEIRNLIYNYLLLLPTPSTRRTLGDPPIYPAILSTCTQLHKEGVQILYGSNTFHADPSLLADIPRLRLYYNKITEDHLISLITRYHVRVRLDCDPNYSTDKVTKAFTGKEEVTIEVFQAQYGSSGHGVLQLFEGVRGVGKAKVYGSVTNFPKYVTWLQDSMMADVGVTRVFEEQSDGQTGENVRPYDMWIHGGR